MSDTGPVTADWQGVGASLRALGRQLRDHATDAGGAISSASGQSNGAVDQVSAVVSAAVASVEATARDPEVADAARDATARLLDAIKAEVLSGRQSPVDPRTPDDEPGDPQAIDPSI